MFLDFTPDFPFIILAYLSLYVFICFVILFQIFCKNRANRRNWYELGGFWIFSLELI